MYICFSCLHYFYCKWTFNGKRVLKSAPWVCFLRVVWDGCSEPDQDLEFCGVNLISIKENQSHCYIWVPKRFLWLFCVFKYWYTFADRSCPKEIECDAGNMRLKKKFWLIIFSIFYITIFSLCPLFSTSKLVD